MKELVTKAFDESAVAAPSAVVEDQDVALAGHVHGDHVGHVLADDLPHLVVLAGRRVVGTELPDDVTGLPLAVRAVEPGDLPGRGRES